MNLMVMGVAAGRNGSQTICLSPGVLDGESPAIQIAAFKVNCEGAIHGARGEFARRFFLPSSGD